MATKVSIAQQRDTAVKALKERGQAIAEQLHIDPPDFNFYFRDTDLHQANELTALAAFLERVQSAVQAPPEAVETERVNNGKSGNKKTASR